jgi:hypothetical protein
MLEEISRLDGMVERLLYFARPLNLSAEPFDLIALVHDCVEARKALMRGDSVTLLYEPEDAKLTVRGDSAKLRQVFDNVLSNAIEALNSAGTVQLHVRARDGGCVVFAFCRPFSQRLHFRFRLVQCAAEFRIEFRWCGGVTQRCGQGLILALLYQSLSCWVYPSCPGPRCAKCHKQFKRNFRTVFAGYDLKRVETLGEVGSIEERQIGTSGWESKWLSRDFVQELPRLLDQDPDIIRFGNNGGGSRFQSLFVDKGIAERGVDDHRDGRH